MTISPRLSFLGASLLCFALQPLGLSPTQSSTDTLRFVHVVFRHGDRSPTHTYPTDPYQEKSWRQGWGQLTEIGMKQAYRLGTFLRERYISSGFLNQIYNSSEMYVRSSDLDRTLMTAQCMLQGLYPDLHDKVDNSSLVWHPIPIHSQSQEDDLLIHLECPTYEKLRDEYMTSKRGREVEKTYQKLIQYIGKHSGYTPSLENLFNMVDPIFCELQHNRSLPQWLTNPPQRAADQIMALMDTRALFKFPTRSMQRIRIGPLMKYILENMQLWLKNDRIVEKAIFLSAHDTNVQGLLSAMKVYDGHVPFYSAVLMLELHEVKKNNFVVRVFYHNKLTLHQLALPGCGKDCSLEEFERLVRDVLPQDPHLECKGAQQGPALTTPTESNSGAVIGLAVTSCLLLVLLIVLGVFTWHRSRSPINQGYSLVTTDISL